MARRLRYFEKKRGNRRTGSNQLGFAWETLFFAALLVVGCAVLWVLVAQMIVPQWQARRFVDHRCTVVQTRIAEDTDGEGTRYRPEIQITYEVEGASYTTWTYDVSRRYLVEREQAEAITRRFVTGKNYTCWYDPTDPRTCVLVRGDHLWVWLVMAVPASFIAIGIGGLLWRLFHWGKSAERRAALVQRVQPDELFATGGRAEVKFPSVPDAGNISSSPGTRLKYRLPIEVSPAWVLFGTTVACAIWNGIAWTFATVALRGHIVGRPDWFLTFFLIPFVLVGAVLIGVFIRQLVVTAGIGPTRLEISSHPLHPGESCRLFLSQSGRLLVNALSVRLVCEEEASYTAGTDMRRETCEVYHQEVFRREDFEVGQGKPFEIECELTIPAEAMHSLRTAHNAIQWKVVVEGDVQEWPEYRRAFPLIVRPSAAEAHA